MAVTTQRDGTDEGIAFARLVKDGSTLTPDNFTLADTGGGVLASNDKTFLGGTTWTAAEVNAALFWLFFCPTIAAGGAFRVDAAYLTVYYDV